MNRGAVKERPFKTEVELCSAFIAALPSGWIPYNECCGWDTILVRKLDGFQIGIQAKLALNLDVINQAIEEYGHWSAAKAGPDCRAVLVPEGGTARLDRVCQYLGLVVITMRGPPTYGVRPFHPSLPESATAPYQKDWHEWAPTKRHKLPEYVPDVAAGASAPLQLTEWKIGAIKLAVILETRGHVTRDDFKHLQIDHRRWIANEWLRLGPSGYIRGGMPDFKAQHPKVYAKIASESAKWMPKPVHR